MRPGKHLAAADCRVTVTVTLALWRKNIHSRSIVSERKAGSLGMSTSSQFTGCVIGRSERSCTGDPPTCRTAAMSQSISSNTLAPSHDDAEFTEAAEALASLAASFLPAGASADDRGSSRISHFRLKRKRSKDAANSRGTRLAGNAVKSRNKVMRMEAVQVISRVHAKSSSPYDSSRSNTVTAPVAETCILPPLLNSFNEKRLDDTARMSLQREVADIRRRYDLSGDLETLLREARELDARLKYMGVQVKHEDLVAEPGSLHRPSEPPIGSEFTASIMQGRFSSSGQQTLPFADDEKRSTSLLAQQEHLQGLSNLDSGSNPRSHPTMDQLTTEEQSHLVRQLQVIQQLRLGQSALDETLYRDPQENKKTDLLDSLLLLKSHQESKSAPRDYRQDLVLSLLQQNPTSTSSSFGENLQQPPRDFIQLLPALQHLQASAKAQVAAQEPTTGGGSDLVPLPEDILLSAFRASASGRPSELPHAAVGSGLSVSHERELALLLLIRQAHLLHHQVYQPSTGYEQASAELAGQRGHHQAPVLRQAQLALRQEAQGQHAGYQDRFSSQFQALQDEGQSHDPLAGWQHDQLVALFLKAHQQQQHICNPSNLVHLTQLQALLQGTSQEETSVPPGVQMSDRALLPCGPQEQHSTKSREMQLLTMLKLFQDQQQQSPSFHGY